MDSCAGFERITPREPIIVGEDRWEAAKDRPLAEAPGDVLTEGTAGQIVAHNRFYDTVCKE